MMRATVSLLLSTGGAILTHFSGSRYMRYLFALLARVLQILLIFVVFPPDAVHAQMANVNVTTSPTQAAIQYVSPAAGACSIQVADMNRAITIASVAQVSTTVTMTTAAPHGLLSGAVIYLEGSGVWNGWQTAQQAASQHHDVHLHLCIDWGPSWRQCGGIGRRCEPDAVHGIESRLAGRAASRHRTARTFVVGTRDADVASDGNRYSRALQNNSRHHFTLTCSMQTLDSEFTTANLPLGNTWNDGTVADASNPGQYSYPTIQWSNLAQTLIDPLTGIRSQRVTGPSGAAAGLASFVTSPLTNWTGNNNPLTNGGTFATFTGPCGAGTCPLFLRADNLSIFGGASFNTGSVAVIPSIGLPSRSTMPAQAEPAPEPTAPSTPASPSTA